MQEQETVESLYVINKHAGQYARRAHRHYQEERHAAATRNSARKEALYDLKGRVLSEISEEAHRVERHEIDGEEYLCLYIGGFSFHARPDEVAVEAEEIDGETEALTDFEKTTEKEIDRTLKASLLHLQDEFGISANDLLPKREASYAHRRSFNGWDYLEEGLMDKPIWKRKREEKMQKVRQAMKERENQESHPRDRPRREDWP